MKLFVEGSERMQGALFPDRLEDFVGEDNAVRVIDALIDGLDLVDLASRGQCWRRPEGRVIIRQSF